MARRNAGAAISRSARLAIALRMLACASHVDIYFGFKMSPAAAYKNKPRVVRLINEILPLPGIPIQDERKLQALERSFTQSRESPLFGAIGAVDRILIPIRKTPDHLCPHKYFCRKGLNALPLQVVCDSSHRFFYESGVTADATLDSIAFSV